jgi:hypothetical protein
MHSNQHNQNEQDSMTREPPEANPDSGRIADREGPPMSKRGRRKDLTPEQVSELQARQRALGQELRRMFDAVTREPVPNELLELVRQIDRKRDN